MSQNMFPPPVFKGEKSRSSGGRSSHNGTGAQTSRPAMQRIISKNSHITGHSASALSTVHSGNRHSSEGSSDNGTLSAEGSEDGNMSRAVARSSASRLSIGSRASSRANLPPGSLSEKMIKSMEEGKEEEVAVKSLDRVRDWLNNHSFANGDMTSSTSVYVFRRGSLRLSDNISLWHACSESKSLVCLYVLDEADLADTMGVRRANFLKECLIDLDKSLTALGQKLFVLKGPLADVVCAVANATEASQIYIDESYEPRERAKILLLQEKSSCLVHTIWQNSMFDSRFGFRNSFPLQFADFLEQSLRMVSPDKPIPPPKVRGQPRVPCKQAKIEFLFESASSRYVDYEIPPVPENLDLKLPQYQIGPDPSTVPKLWHMGSYTGVEYWYTQTSRPPVPSAVDEGSLDVGIGAFNPMRYAHLLPGGEACAMVRVEKWLSSVDVATYSRVNEAAPANKGKSSMVSAYLAWGCVSSRMIYAAVEQEYRLARISPSQLRLDTFHFGKSLMVGMYWREFFIMVSCIVPNFDNENCPVAARMNWKHDSALLEAVCNGVTGVPCVDAIARQIRNQGWTSHMCRRVFADFFTHSGLNLSPHCGIEFFKYFMLDYEYGVTEGNWMIESRIAFCTILDMLSLKDVVSQFTLVPNADDFVQSMLPELEKYQHPYTQYPWHLSAQTRRIRFGEPFREPILNMNNMPKFIMQQKEWLQLEAGPQILSRWTYDGESKEVQKLTETDVAGLCWYA